MQNTVKGEHSNVFPYAGKPLEFTNFTLTLLPLTNQLNFYDKIHKCSLSVELNSAEMWFFNYMAETLTQIAEANTNETANK